MQRVTKTRRQAVLMIFAVLLSLLSPFSSISGSQTAKAATVAMTGLGAKDATITDASGNDVTNDPNLDMYGNYKVNYNWSIADNVKINAGDTATFTLPSSIDAPTTDTTVKLVGSDGVTSVGTATILKGQTTGTITFTDALASTVSGRKGTLSFNLKGKTDLNSGSGDYQVSKNGWIDPGSVESDGTPTQIVWNVVANHNNEDQKDVTLTDTMGPNQEYVPGSLQAYYDDKTPVQPTVTQNGNVLTIKLGDISKAVNIVYFAKLSNVNANQGNTWTNKVDGTSSNGTGSSAEASKDVVWGGGGTASGYSGSATLTKKDSKTGAELTGAVFDLMQGNTVVKSGLTTNTSGEIKADGLADGDYQFVETKARL
ncbi:hypothetical protein BSQ39_11665 [Loigolactobacillus backii]|uniref:SpaA isopeptide-forming pilin-related protein n=1 Tax=Loigolactobacillus backii TaxID=375175 RepID=UPI000C1CC193|nr:Ig-like domain-containing protein [Loigolactobacillus backii]PIO84171.1 hypothetical protein BSQ39_11665 [Loigolactobacillus backii]